MTIRINFENKGDIKKVSYLASRNLKGYITNFIGCLVIFLIIYLFLSQNLKTMPLYFPIFIVILLALSYFPKKAILTYNSKEKILLARLIGIGGFTKRKYSFDMMKKSELMPKVIPKLIGFSFFYNSKMLTSQQVEEISEFFNIKSSWLKNTIGTEPNFGMPSR